MSRQENYFHRVKELITDEQKIAIVNHFYKHKDAYDRDDLNKLDWVEDEEHLRFAYEKYSELTFSEFKNMVRDYKERSLTKYNSEGEPRARKKPLEDGKAKFYHQFRKPEMFNIPEIKILEKLYLGEAKIFLHTNGDGITVGKHKDIDRNCCVTIPLIPDYSEYRSCYFYDKYEDNNPKHILDYSKLRSPVLLNNQKIHSVDNKQQDKPSLCIQVSYEFEKSYIEIRKMLSEKGLLI